jgi:two-component system, sensor histidine kinase ChiS
VLDLTGWDMEKDGPVRLDGEWEFYWGQLLTPDDFKDPRSPKKTGYLPLPSAWNSFEQRGKKLGGTGYATLHLHVITGQTSGNLALNLFDIYSAYALWLNGNPFIESGVVGKTFDEEVPDPSSLVREFRNEENSIDLVLQVSNYNNREGGILSSVRLGSEMAIHAENARQRGTALFFIGSLLVMGVYHLALYCFRRKNISPLFFGIYCLLWMGNSLTSDSSGWVIRLFLPGAPIQILERFSLICFFLSIPIGYRFFSSLYTQEFSVRIQRFTQIMAGVFVCCALFLPALRLLTALLPVYYLFSLLLIIYCLFKLYRARKKGREGATFILAGFLILGLIAVNDMLYDLQVIHSIYLIQVGMFVFILFQALAISLRFSRAFATVERLSEELEENNLTLSRMDRIKDEFLANTSHELRTPLSGIIGLSESLLEGVAGPLPPKAVGDLSLVVASARRLAGLVNDILDFSLLENRDLDLQIKAVDLRSLVDVVLAVSTPLARGKGIETVNAIPPGTPCVEGDEDRLLQIFFNLIGNAIKFTDHGEVRVTAENQGEFVEIVISDTGSGIPADQIETIFLPFEQVDSSASRAANGVGLGLAISRHLAKLHGGKLWAESTLGRGSLFHITLPVRANPSESAPPRNPVAPYRLPPMVPASIFPSFPGPAGGSTRVLAVDDDPINLQVIRNHLELAGMSVITASNGQEALALIEAGQAFDLVLLDVMMPGMTGFEVCRRLRLRYSVTELPVIMLTARKRVSDLTEGLDSGANDYLGKPFAREELLARTRVQLKMLEAEEEARSKGRFAMMGELAAGIAHEVNTPINTIINSSQLILLADNREDLEHDAMIIRDEGRRIAGIVGGLLSFAHRGKGEKAPCTIGRIVSDSIRLIEAKLRKEQIRLLVDIPDTIPDVKANPQQMMQVFLNLINNAAHALHEKFPESHDDKTIRITAEPVHAEGGTLVRLTFHDRGNGIPAHLLNKVMKPFFTTKPAGMGTGLGLSVTQGIIADHGGTMWLESIEGIFTKVTVELPVQEKE